MGLEGFEPTVYGSLREKGPEDLSSRIEGRRIICPTDKSSKELARIQTMLQAHSGYKTKVGLLNISTQDH